MSNADFIGSHATLDTLVASIDSRLDEAQSEIQQLEGARAALLAIKAPAPKAKPRRAKVSKAQSPAKSIEPVDESTEDGEA